MGFWCHYKFINITTFDFLDDSIIAALSYELKRGYVTDSIHMNIDTSELTQIQISKNTG